MNKKEIENHLNILENEHFKLRVEEGKLKKAETRTDNIKNRLEQISLEKNMLESKIIVKTSELKNL